MSVYKYKFRRIDEGWLWPTIEADTYKDVIEKYANKVWKQTQIFAPNRGFWGLAYFHYFIF